MKMILKIGKLLVEVSQVTFCLGMVQVFTRNAVLHLR